MSSPKQPNLRAVNPEEIITKSSAKTIAITAVISTLSGMIALAGGQALWRSMRKVVRGKKDEEQAPQLVTMLPPQYPQVYPQAPYPSAYPQPYTSGHPQPWPQAMSFQPQSSPSYIDQLPQALLMQPQLQSTESRQPKRKDGTQAPPWFRDFASRNDKRLSAIEQQLSESFEDEEESDD